MKRFFISLHVIIPVIFAGLATLSAIVAFQVTHYSISTGSPSSLPVYLWILIISVLTFFCALLVSRLLLGPVRKFVRRVEQLPALSSADIDRSSGMQLDELKHFAQVFNQVTNVLSNVDAQQLSPKIIGDSSSMRRVLGQIMLVAPTDSTVLILGERGTGKELVATSIYEHSLRKDKPFAKVNCTGVPENLLESELFGVKIGVSLGAPDHKPGKLEFAQGGIVFVNEIADMSLPTQAKILRVLREYEFERIGDTRSIRANVRLVAATGKDLSKLVSEGRFREDLYYHLSVFSLHLPPLRERKGDVPVLVEHFLRNAPKRAEISPSALKLLMVYGWPGNVRELRDTIERAAAVCENGIIEVDHLPRNITQSLSHHVESVLQHAQKMESIGTIASGMAHNFRNVLSGISVNNQLLQMKYQDNQKLQESTERISHYITRGSQLVQDLMQFSRKQPKSRFKILNLTEVLQETHHLIKESFDKKIEIYAEFPEKLNIMGDLSGLSQVFMNLCTNARDAMPNGGELKIEARQKSDNAEIIVSDTGHGMDMGTQAKCFDPFFTTKEADKGTGLGLSTTYGIIRYHGGEITVQSAMKKGTAFTISLPMVAAEEEDKQDPEPEILMGSGQKVLIVDDEAETLEPMEDLIESLGYQAASVESGKEAVAKYKTWDPDVVLMDRNMPDMDGIECTERIIEYDSAAKIVIISGYDASGPDSISEPVKSLVKGYLTKPVEMVGLSRMLTQALEK